MEPLRFQPPAMFFAIAGIPVSLGQFPTPEAEKD